MRDQNFGLLFSARLMCYVEAVAQLLLSLLAQTVAGLQGGHSSEEGMSLGEKCGKRRDSKVKVLPSGNSRILDQLSCLPDHTVKSIKSIIVDFNFGVNVGSFTVQAVIEKGRSAHLLKKNSP